MTIHTKRNRLPHLAKAGFTLLEVMIAISILAIAYVTLLGSQAKSLSLATETRFMLEASLLIDDKLADFESGIETLTSSSGTFDEIAPRYKWSTETEEVSLDIEDLPTEDLPQLIKLTITVAQDGTPLTHSRTLYTFETDGE